MSRAVFHRLLGSGVVLAMLALSACSGGPLGGLFGGHASSDAVGPSGAAGPGPVDLATQQACRRRVNEMYEIRDRGDIYAANPSSNTPSSANSEVGVPSRGLASQFAYERSRADCERDSSGSGPVGR
jgi:hypothetical protein